MPNHTDLIAALNPDKLDFDTGDYSQSNALYCAALSILIYRSSSNITTFLADLNTAYTVDYTYEFIEDEKSDTQLIFFGCERFVVIAFRGTAGFKDFWTDLKFGIYESLSSEIRALHIPTGHGGFRRAAINLFKKQNFTQRLGDFCNQFALGEQIPIILTGHSLGGALSNVFIEPLEHLGFNVVLNYNFATPKMFSNSVLTYLRGKHKSKVYDIVNYKDYVPRAGSSIYRKLGRIGKFYAFDKNEILALREERYFKFSWKERLRLFKSINKYHSIFVYFDQLAQTENDTAQVINRQNDIP